MSATLPAMSDLLPHAGSAILLDDVVACTETGLSASVTIHAGSAFCQGSGGVPAHVGIEYMAQACGAFSGLQARREGAAPRPGFLLGARRYTAIQDWFAEGMRLLVTVDLVYRDNEIGMFDCNIRDAERTIATAALVVAEPKDAAPLLGRRSRLDNE